MPGIEGGMAMYQNREHYERAASFGHYEDPPKFAKSSPYRGYGITGLGQKYRMHPFAAAVLRARLRGLDELNPAISMRVRSLNNRLIQLPGLSERAAVRPDAVYYAQNQLLFDEKKAGFSKAAAVKALQAEGVAISGPTSIRNSIRPPSTPRRNGGTTRRDPRGSARARATRQDHHDHAACSTRTCRS